MLTIPSKTSCEVARKRANTRESNGNTRNYFNVSLRDVGTYSPGIEIPVEEHDFLALNEGDQIEAVFYLGTRSLDAKAQSGNMYQATVPAMRLVEYKVTKKAPEPVAAAA